MSIQITGLTKKYGNQKAVNDISFEVKSGEIIGFIGPNGAGKSTTMKVITGFLSDFEGEVLVNGLSVRENSIDVKNKIGYLPEHNPLYLEMYVREYLQFVAGVYKIKSNVKQKVDETIELTGLQKEAHKLIGSLSKGYRQRVGLAAVLLHDPEVLILDEPTTGLDPNQIVEIRNLIAKVGKEKTVMLSTHIMQEVEAICNRVIIINNGKIVANNDSQSIKKQSSHNQTTIAVEFMQDCTQELLQSINQVEKVVHVIDNKWLITAIADLDIREAIFNFAVKQNLTVISMQIQEKSLEEAFQDLTNSK